MVGSLFFSCKIDSLSESSKPFFCDLYGSIYITNSTKDADYTYWEVANSDNFNYVLQVYDVSSPVDAHSKGRWYFTSSPDSADYILYKNPTPMWGRDFSIYVTSSTQNLSNSNCE